jgi:2,4'-dihydroxyacetophenone dioxygenase
MDLPGLVTLHNHSSSVPWVDFDGGTRVRILHARPSEDFIVTQIHAPPGSESRLHRHLGPVFGWTNEGRWGHDHTFEYSPGTYIFETPGVNHRFYAGDNHVEAIFVSYGILEFINPETLEVSGSLDSAGTLNYYMEMCEKAGLPRPNVLA